MNFNDTDDALSAPVWDDLNPPTKKQELNADVPEELSSTFATLNTGDELVTNPIVEVSEGEEEKFDVEGKPFQSHWVANAFASQDQNDSDNREGVRITKDSNALLLKGEVKNEDTDDLNISKADLMNELASSEVDPASGWTNPSIEPTTYNINAPLFSGDNSLPLAFNDTGKMDELQSTLNLHSNATNLGKPKILFNSRKMLKRKDYERDHLKSINTDDPLGKAQKDSEFIDEPLDDNTTSISNVNPVSKGSDIKRQMEEPLYKLSPKKDHTQTNEAKKENDKPTEVKQAPIEEPKPEFVKFDIVVKDPRKVGELTSAHIEYMVVAEAKILESGCSIVYRRYRDFRWLYRQLQNNHWGKIIPPPPEKQAVGRFKQDFIENRRLQMENMLQTIASSDSLQNDSDFILFLTSKDFPQDCKKREYESGSNACNDSGDLSITYISEIQLLGEEDGRRVIKNGGLLGESDKGFLSLSFSAPPKYVEVDNFLNERLKTIDNLSNELKEMYKTLETVDTERTNLASSLTDIQMKFESLSELNVTTESTSILNSLVDVEKAIQQSLERCSFQESLIMGTCIDNYSRSLASVRAIFNQRMTMGAFMMAVENDLRKKKSQGERVLKYAKGQNDPDKFEAFKLQYKLAYREESQDYKVKME